MADNRTEQAVKAAMCAHRGGLGPSLSEEAKEEIINGLSNTPENDAPVDEEKLYACFISSLERHPIEWILK